jgi:hypothetical protein
MICATLLRCRWTAGRDGKDWTRRNQPGSGGAAHGLFLTEEGRLKKGFLVSFLVSQHGVEAPRWFVGSSPGQCGTIVHVTDGAERARMGMGKPAIEEIRSQSRAPS